MFGTSVFLCSASQTAASLVESYKKSDDENELTGIKKAFLSQLLSVN